MYCPLCKAEYRDGFDKCSDCQVALVSASEEAEAAPVVLLWRGTSQATFSKIADALQEANIPSHARSGAYADEQRKSFLDYIPIISRYKRVYDQMTWEISVLNSDYAKAQLIVRNRA